MRPRELPHERRHPPRRVLGHDLGQGLLVGVLDAMPDDAEPRENAVLLPERRRQFLVEPLDRRGSCRSCSAARSSRIFWRPGVEAQMPASGRRKARAAAGSERRNPASGWRRSGPRPGPPGRKMIGMSRWISPSSDGGLATLRIRSGWMPPRIVSERLRETIDPRPIRSTR